MRAIVDNMNENNTSTWTTSELYELYISASGTLSKKQMIYNINKYVGTEVITMHIEGCESGLGSVGSMVKLVKTMGGDGTTSLTSWCGNFKLSHWPHQDLVTMNCVTSSTQSSSRAPARLFSGLYHVWIQEAALPSRQ